MRLRFAHDEEDNSRYILDYNKEIDAYMILYNYEKKGSFIGTNEDFLDLSKKDLEKVIKRNNLPENTTHINYNDLYISDSPNNLVFDYYAIKTEKTNNLPYGSYEFAYVKDSIALKSLDISSDKYIDLGANSESAIIHKQVSNFFKPETKEAYKELGTRYRASSLLYGPPGAGKTTTLLHAVKEANLDKVYVLYISKKIYLSDLFDMKRFFENENVIIVLEELTERLERGSEDMLNFLDGHYSWTNCYVFGTTNYPENLPDNIVNRPGRFNELIEFPNATEDQKRIYLKAKGFDDADIDSVMHKLKDFTLDYITQLAIRSKINKEPLGVYLKVLEANREKIKRSFKKNSGKVGLI